MRAIWSISIFILLTLFLVVGAQAGALFQNPEVQKIIVEQIEDKIAEDSATTGDDAVVETPDITPDPQPQPQIQSYFFHHTSDGVIEGKKSYFYGKAIIVQCVNDPAFDACAGMIRHGRDNQRWVWVDNSKVIQPGATIQCSKGNTTYLIKYNKGVVYGDCSAPSPTPPDDLPVVDPVTNIKGDYQGRLKDHDRPYWYWPGSMSSYPAVFKIQVSGCKSITVNNNGKRVEVDGYHGYIVKQSDVQNRNKMALIGPQSCKATKAVLKH